MIVATCSYHVGDFCSDNALLLQSGNIIRNFSSAGCRWCMGKRFVQPLTYPSYER